MFIATAAVLGEAGKQNVTDLGTYLVLDSLYCCGQFALAGLAIALVYGRARD